MAIHHAESGEVVHLPLGTSLASSETTTIVKTPALEVIRLVVPAGKEIPTHKAPGPMTVQCLEGRVFFTAHGSTRELEAGTFLHLSDAAPHALRGIEDASLLITLLLPQR